MAILWESAVILHALADHACALTAAITGPSAPAGFPAEAASALLQAAYDAAARVPSQVTASADGVADAAGVGGQTAAQLAWGRWILGAIDVLAVAAIVVCVPVQRRAMNRIAFGRSVFISLAAIVTGFLISLIPTVSAAVVGSLLMVLGFGFMILMGVKSYQHLRRQRDKRQ
ncbi:MAG: hypothetical protein IRZ33_10065 [Alicyclobacillaceae bacterium]|nr:hypothetical protein [Alicyclobacillaceae bacterium]